MAIKKIKARREEIKLLLTKILGRMATLAELHEWDWHPELEATESIEFLKKFRLGLNLMINNLLQELRVASGQMHKSDLTRAIEQAQKVLAGVQAAFDKNIAFDPEPLRKFLESKVL